jgi:hypothetical protein
MMAQIDVPLVGRGFGSTRRTDNWWVEPTLIFFGYLLFILYATWSALNPDCGIGPCNVVPGTDYVSPMSPFPGMATPSWWPAFIPFSGALLILWAPAGFRFTCYFNRGAYYKGWWADPVACTVGEPGFRGKNYRGERWLPLVLQNSHRYFLYLAIILVIHHLWDNLHAFNFNGQFGLGLGTIILWADMILLGLYVFGCHSFRHLVGGRKDSMAAAELQKKCYECASHLNKDHGKWAWISMYFTAFADFYIRLCAAGTITDLRII